MSKALAINAALIEAACDAEEMFDLDELEEYAEAFRAGRRKPENKPQQAIP